MGRATRGSSASSLPVVLFALAVVAILSSSRGLDPILLPVAVKPAALTVRVLSPSDRYVRSPHAAPEPKVGRKQPGQPRAGTVDGEFFRGQGPLRRIRCEV